MAMVNGNTLPVVAEGGLQLFIDAYRAQVGRPTAFNELLAAEIIERLTGGETMTSICEDDHMPSFGTVLDWAEFAPEFGHLLANARRRQATALVEEGKQILDEAATDSMSHVQKADKRAQYRMAMAKCYDRETYGEKVQQDVNLRGVVITTADPNLRRLLED